MGIIRFYTFIQVDPSVLLLVGGPLCHATIRPSTSPLINFDFVASYQSASISEGV